MVEVLRHRGRSSLAGGAVEHHASSPQPFAEMPVSYDRAFGGADGTRRPGRARCLHAQSRWPWLAQASEGAWVDGTPLPNIEDAGEGVSRSRRQALACRLGPLGRGWTQRARFAGTYDQQLAGRCVSRSCPATSTSGTTRLRRRTNSCRCPRGRWMSRLAVSPRKAARSSRCPIWAPVHVFPKRGEREDYMAALDTIAFEPDLEHFTMSWRVARPLKKNMLRDCAGAVGRKDKAGGRSRP